MYLSLVYGNAEGTIIQATRDDDRKSIIIVEPDQAELFELLRSGAIMPVAEFQPPPAPTEAEILQRQRQGLSTTVALLRIAIHRAGETSRAETALSQHPEQSIIWCTGGKVSRLGFISEALSTQFSDAEIDALFRSAMAITL